ncbi:MAG: outer membrane beta-barrel protein [Planctomycetota bacterium]
MFRNTRPSPRSLPFVLFAAAASSLVSCRATGSAASAASGSGFYAKALLGAGVLEDAEANFEAPGGAITDGEGSFEAGALAGLALGYRPDDRWAVELEFTYRSNDVDEIVESGGAVSGTGGDFASTALMLNAFYEFDTDWALDPYVGLGFGLATEVDLDVNGGAPANDGSYSTESPAAQFMVGGRRSLGDALDLFVEGRFFRAFDPDMGGEGSDARFESEYGHTSLLVGLGYRF